MESILSTGEREVAALLAEGMEPEAIAAERDVSAEQVDLAIERIRDKTRRAYATLADSPIAAEVAANLDLETRRSVAAALDGLDD